MYIRVEFEDVTSDNTKETQCLLFGIPNGMFLTSSNARMIYSKEMQEAFGNSVMFWHLDINILNKHYGGVLNCLNSLLRYPGVCRVDILPIEGDYDTFIDKYDELLSILMNYISGV